MRLIGAVAVLVSMVFGFAQPVAAQGGYSIATLTCLQDLTGRWEVRLDAPGYQRLTAFTWNYDLAFLSTPMGWQPAHGYWWGGPDQVWFRTLDAESADYQRWTGPYTDARVLYGTQNTGTVYVNEYQWDVDANVWDGPYGHSCTLTQWVPTVPISWPNL